MSSTAGWTMTRRWDTWAAANLTLLMERRKSEGRETVSPGLARSVLAALVNRSDRDGACHPGLETISAESDVPVRTVQRVLAVLVDEGLLSADQRSTAPGARGDQRRSLLTIDFGALSECAAGGRRSPSAGPGSRATAAHDPERSRARVAPESARSGAAPARDQAPVTERSGARDGAATTSGTAQEPPPYGGSRGGGEECAADETPDAAASEPTTDRAWAERIAEAYPPSPGALPLADADAVVLAIATERDRHGGATPAEILAAVAEYANAIERGKVREPVWLRTWAGQRGYWPFVRLARAAADRRRLDVAGTIGVSPDDRRRADEDAAMRDAADVDAALAGLDDMALHALCHRVAADADARVASIYRRADPRTSRMLRVAMAELLEADRAAAPRAVGAGP